MTIRTFNNILTITKASITDNGFEFASVESNTYKFTTKMDSDSKQKILDELYETGKVDLRKYQ